MYKEQQSSMCKWLSTQNRLVALAFFAFAATSCQTTSQNKAINFISQNPVIDGQLDANLEHLDIRTFNHIWQFDNPVTDTVLVTYRMAYTPSHLYVYIETGVDSITYHRRGYLWGDGYKVLLGISQKDSLTDEYYELKFSPTLEKDYEWGRQGMNYTINEVGKRLSAKTQSQEMAQRDVSGFEALIAWDDIEPYHPWFMDEMGYNIYFAKGIVIKEHDWITNGYSLVEDEGIWDEVVQKRNYEIMSYANPTSVKEQVILAKPKKKNLQTGESLSIEIVSIDKMASKQELNISFLDSDSKELVSKSMTVQTDTKLKKEEVVINLEDVESGTYQLVVHDLKDTLINDAISILPIIDFQKIGSEIQENSNDLQTGVVSTMQFEINEISRKLKNLKVYETGKDILVDWNSFEEKYLAFIVGTDPYKNQTKPYRRAFQSKYDDTYQPYSIKLPENYNPKKKYPLLVFMHGSGQDEQGLLNSPRSGGNFIEIAPLARDIYNAYSEDASQKDIVEAIEDAIEHFSIDTNKIIMGGFSMGGYGSLRAFYEHPELYEGVVVHAGHPNLANEWLDGDYPNFLEEQYLAPFANVSVFIYHGRKDPACDVKLIEEMSKKLTEAGAIVTISIVEENGHEYPDEKTNQLYFEWLNRTVKR